MKTNTKMKIGIITFHRADNYGALLQTYGLQESVRELGHDVEIIDYRCDAIENAYVYKKIPKPRKNIVKWLFDLIIRNPKMNHKRDRCQYFRKKYLHLTDSVKTIEERKMIQNSFDVIITGSDQIWNSQITNSKDDWYCFKQESFEGARIISYGASVGNIESFDDNIGLYENDLNKYYKISVREQETADYLEQKLNTSIMKVVDPTLLLNDSFWNNICDNSTINIEGDYILYYDVKPNSIAMEITRKISSMKSMKLVHFNSAPNMFLEGRLVLEAGPCEFLNLIKNAKYIVTSSFHATVFSILFQKQFITVPHPTTGGRVKGILEDFDLNERIVENTEQFSMEMLDAAIDYRDVINRLENESKRSIEWLQSSLQ